MEYFQRTIARATRKTGGGAAAIASVEEAIAGAGPLSADQPATDTAQAVPGSTPAAPPGAPVAPETAQPSHTATELTAAQKDAVCAKVAAAMKTPIVQSLKITGKEPTYHIKLAGGRVVEVAGFGRFTNQQYIYEAIGNATNRRIPKFKPAAWVELSNMMLEACYIEEPSDEEDLVAAARLHILSYLHETEFIASIEDQRVQDQRKPIITDDGRIAVSTLDLQAYLAKTTCQKVSQREAGSMLVAVGGTKYRVTGRKYDQIRRVLPTPEFDPKEIRPQEARHGA